MRKLLFLLLLSVLTLAAANFKLYLKDGGYQLVREYNVEGDRIKFYSVERSDWEEIPVALVDLKRTQAETGAQREQLAKQEREADDEKAAARELREQIHKIPRDPGVYRLDDQNQLRVFEKADASVHDQKGRNALKALSPLPIFAGQAALEIPGEHSSAVVKDTSPEFYLQLETFESFSMIKLAPTKGQRVVEHITTEPISKEITEQRTVIPTFTRELSDNGLYRIWPQDPLAPGEYAVVEYTEGKVNIQVWDFRVQ
jgi:hypothetical protein